MTPVKDRLIRVRFNADTAATMQWNFRPQQTEITVSNHQLTSNFYDLIISVCIAFLAERNFSLFYDLVLCTLSCMLQH